MEILVRPAQPGDAQEMARLFFETVRNINARDYTREQIEAWAPRPFSADEWRLRQGDKIVLVALHQGGLVGFGELDRGGHIDGFYVHKDHQRRGVGSCLLTAIEALALDGGIPRIFADVSLTARPFFSSKGFVVGREQEVERRGVRMRNTRMEKRLA